MAECVNEMKMNPFLLFPEEVWEMILNQVEDSLDAWNLFQAFPQLDLNSALQKKKHLWLLGMVIPHLTPWRATSWITEKELLNCRRVCRMWSTHVDNFLETQPQLRVYHPDAHEPGRLYWNTRSYLEKKSMNPRAATANYFGGTSLNYAVALFSEDAENFSHSSSMFLKDMGNHPPGRNPFLSRSLSIFIPSEYVDNDETIANYWNDAIAIHRKFGEQIWYYNIYIHFHKIDLDSGVIPQCLSRLPNLRRLSICAFSGYPSLLGQDLDRMLKSIGTSLPPLPNLESLRINSSFEGLDRLLLTRFARQIRRLEIQIGSWRSEYAQMFPNLTELRVAVVEVAPEKNYDNIFILAGLLRSLEAPELAKLKLILTTSGEVTGKFSFGIEHDMFHWLRRFPKLRYLDFGEECQLVMNMEDGSLTPELDSCHSLEFLSIRTSIDMNYNFLRCLPALQHLQLFVESEPVVHDNSSNPGGLRIREEIMHANMLKSNIWELLPKLKTVTLLKDEFTNWEWELRGKWAFNRAEYEYLQEHGSISCDNVPLRQDVSTFIQMKYRG